MATTKFSARKRYDALIENHISFCLVRPLTVQTRQWLQTHTAGQWYGTALFVEMRYVEDVAAGLVNAGFRL